jgi:N-succinyldiaminopimelate aminotransferase
MNPLLEYLSPYPFVRLNQLFSGVTKPLTMSVINLGVGEPKHPTPECIKKALCDAVNETPGGLSSYPSTIGAVELRTSIGRWIGRRYGVQINPENQILTNNGSREALFSFGQMVLDSTRAATLKPIVICPNPFYQIYEGAAILGGAQIYFTNQSTVMSQASAWHAIDESVWQRTQMIYACSPDNPTGSAITLEQWAYLFELSDRYNFVIAADECYSEIYFEGRPPVSALQAAIKCGRLNFKNLVVFNSLSKRSNAPGLRSGFCAGDADILKKFLLYRTYHGSAMSPVVQAASVAAWNDDEHVKENRVKYTEKFNAVLPILNAVLNVNRPEAGFFLWLKIPGSDTEFARNVYEQCNVTLLPGSYLSREFNGENPGYGYVRMALVPEIDECIEAAHRIATFLKK